MEDSTIVSLSNRIYNLLVYAYPKPFRREYGCEMSQFFRDDVRGTLREGGMSALFRLWFITFFDLFKTAFAEHIWEVFHMPVEKMTRWSGPAAALGGLLFTLGIILNTGEFSVALGILTFLIPVPFLGLGQYGLFRRLPTNNGLQNRLSVVLALGGLVVYNLGIVAALLTDNDSFVTLSIIAFLISAVGMTGMGIMALKNKSLGNWSFAPLLVGGVSLFIIIAFMRAFYLSIESNNPISVFITIIIFGVSWVIMGIGLLQNQEDEAGPALIA